MKLNLIHLLLVILPGIFYGQVNFSGTIQLEGYYSSQDDLPFWFYSNQRGRVSNETNFDGWVTGKMNYDFSSEARLEVGAGVLYRDGSGDNVVIDELYADFNYKKLQIILGRKQRPEMYHGLSAANENILWSLNAQPVPGIQIKTNAPVYPFLNKKFGFEASWNEYYLGDNPGAEDVRLHHKSLTLLYNFNKGWNVGIGLQHFVQWAGYSERLGAQPKGLTDYLKVITGRGGGENSSVMDQDNALGNHLGSWEIKVTKSTSRHTFQFIFNNLFEDGSGSRLANFPDGRYGIFIEPTNKKEWLTGLLYEFYYTKDQSQTGPHPYDNYFNSVMYPHGWTYNNRVLGVPFFEYDRHLNVISNNTFLAHQLGATGNLFVAAQQLPYKFMLSYASNKGTYSTLETMPDIDEDRFNFYSEWRLLNAPVVLNLKLGLEIHTGHKPIFATGLSFSRTF